MCHCQKNKESVTLRGSDHLQNNSTIHFMTRTWVSIEGGLGGGYIPPPFRQGGMINVIIPPTFFIQKLH